jgi:arylsulfatase A-like enzyme
MKLGLPNFARLLAGALCMAASPAPAAERPNILFIFSDDHAVQAISAYGSKVNKTPNIDRIAREGAIFDLNFCANSICAPSRACVLTGKHSHLNGVPTWQRFDGSQTTFPKLLHGAGYTTALYGKWHLVSDPTGFDEWMVYPGQGDYYNPDFLTPTGRTRIVGYTVDVTTDLALDFIRRKKDAGKPFLVMCQYKAPHRNWMPAPKYHDLFKGEKIPEPDTLFDDYAGRASPASHHKMGIKDLRPLHDLKVAKDKEEVSGVGRMTPEQRAAWDNAYREENEAFLKAGLTGDDLVRWKYQRYMKDYLKCVASVDDNVGRILDYLKESGLAENTLVVYSSDQGFYLGEHGWFDKRWMYEESFRMPLMARWPGVVPAGTRIGELTQNIDFAPTFLEACGLPVPAEMQGKSLMPLLKGEKVPWRDALYYHYYDHGGEHNVARQYGIRTKDYKLIHYYTTDEWELFDLKKDPHEMKSVYDEPAYKDIRAKLDQELRDLKKSIGNEIFTLADEERYFRERGIEKK